MQTMKAMIADEGDHRAIAARPSIESCAELRPDRALLEHGDLGRQRAGAQQDREPRRLLGREVAGDDAGAAGDVAWITGAEITSSSSTIAKGLPMFSAVYSPKAAPPVGLKRKLTAGRPFWSKLGWLSTSCSPVTTARRSST